MELAGWVLGGLDYWFDLGFGVLLVGCGCCVGFASSSDSLIEDLIGSGWMKWIVVYGQAGTLC